MSSLIFSIPWLRITLFTIFLSMGTEEYFSSAYGCVSGDVNACMVAACIPGGFYAADICKNGCDACYQLGLDQYNCQPSH